MKIKPTFLIGVAALGLMALATKTHAGSFSLGISIGIPAPVVVHHPPPAAYCPPVVRFPAYRPPVSYRPYYPSQHQVYHHLKRHDHQAFHHELSHIPKAYKHEKKHAHRDYHHQQKHLHQDFHQRGHAHY